LLESSGGHGCVVGLAKASSFFGFVRVLWRLKKGAANVYRRVRGAMVEVV